MSCRDGVPDITEIFLFLNKITCSLDENWREDTKNDNTETEKVVDHQTIINRSEYFFLLQMEF